MKKRDNENVSKSQFNHDVKRGNGQAYLILLNAKDRENYKNELLEACLRCDTLNAQDEPGRADYLYRMIRLYPDPSYFEAKIIEKLNDPTMEFGLFDQLSDLLTFMAKEGSHKALDHMWALYDILIDRMKNEKSSPEIESNLDHLAVDLDQILGFTAFEKIAQDYVDINLMLDLHDFDMSYFFFMTSEKYGKSITQAYTDQFKPINETDNIHDQQRPRPEKAKMTLQDIIDQNDKLNHYQIRKYLETVTSKELDDLFELIKKEPDFNRRFRLLSFFSFTDHPIDIELVIGWLKDQKTPFPDRVYWVLLRRPCLAVYDYAKSKLSDRKHANTALILMCASFNHQEKDELIYRIKHIKNKFFLHDLFSWALLKLYERDTKAPEELMWYYLHESVCSHCRFSLVKIMGKRKLLSRDNLVELTFDCNQNTIDYAKSLLEAYTE